MTPEPPYDGYPMAPRWREVAFDQLPVGLQRQIQRRLVGDTEPEGEGGSHEVVVES